MNFKIIPAAEIPEEYVREIFQLLDFQPEPLSQLLMRQNL